MSKKSKIIELFLTVGIVVGLGACNNEVATDEVSPANAEEISAEGGEGGEGEEYSEGEQANADFKDKLAGEELLSALQQGGHVIYFRHAQTERDYADQVKADVNNCSTQRVLSEIGWQQAKTIGEAFQGKEIPVGKVISSEYCRAWQTADLAFDQYEKNSDLNFLPFEDYTDEQVAQMKENVTPLLIEQPESGENTVIVGHDDIFESATGIYPDPQGMAYVLKPDGSGNFELIANMLPDEWSKL
ncbi:histidine phosphatase family protein [Lusitaniella coriacea LEGE 07157]|uniref:Histidine phosphatase family protein n=1 Tax=Lusitaniella coriacea LEGE 07157 TaxID=945747 RepID=A0A8J7DVK6_9CYAN|nr:histidine phosphatase family protein [Lusitaniella coriacea]MBE9115876.1 histidine phosphatase family protein [Lusitaniella coriacea LEGE 07157]